MGFFEFEQPWFLAGLVTLAVPFLLLLTKAKSYRTIPFSSVLFLKSIIEKASQVIEWKRLLLLACRVLILLFLSLAFAMPYFSQSGSFLKGKEKHVILILDDSYSMNYREGKQTLFERAVEEAKKAIEDMKDRTAFYSLYRMSDHLIPVLTKTEDKALLHKTLQELQVSEADSQPDGFMAELETALRQDEHPKQIFFFSDFSVPHEEKRRIFESSLSGGNVFTQPKPVQPQEAYRNFSLETVVMPPRPFLPGQPEEITVTYRAFGMKAGEKVKVKLWAGEDLIQEKEAMLDSSGAGKISFNYRFPAAGRFKLHVEAEEDRLSNDNHLFRIVSVEKPLKILLLEDASSPYAFQSPSFFLVQALQSYEGKKKSAGPPWIDAARIHPDNLKSVSLDTYDLVILADPVHLEEKSLSQLRYYIKGGGRLLLSLGPHFNPSEFQNAYWIKFLGGSFGEPRVLETPRTFNPQSIDYSHPMLRLFDGGSRGNLSRIKVSCYVPFRPLSESLNYRILMRFEEKGAALLEETVENGKIFIWTTSLNADWTDFPKDPLYVPFMFEFLKYAALRNWQHPVPLKVGQSAEINWKDYPSGQILLTSPRKEQRVIYQGADRQNPVFQVNHAGFYEWTAGDHSLPHHAAVNVSAEEAVAAYFVPKGIEVRPEKPLQEEHFLQRKEYFYSPLLYGVILFLLAETWLANRFYHPKWI